MHRLFIAVAAFAAVFLTGAAQAADTATVIDAFTVENVTAVLNELQATNIKTEKEENVTTVTADVAGLPVSLGIQKCGTNGCVGMLIGAAFDAGGKVSSETLLGFTGKYPPTPAIRLDGNGVAIVRAEIAIGGIRSSNLKANIAVLVLTIPIFAKYIKDAVVASNQTPGANVADVRPTYLSAKDMKNLTFMVPDVSELPTRKSK